MWIFDAYGLKLLDKIEDEQYALENFWQTIFRRKQILLKYFCYSDNQEKVEKLSFFFIIIRPLYEFGHYGLI